MCVCPRAVQFVGNDLMEVTAFRRPDGDIVVIVLNRSDYSTDFKLRLVRARLVSDC